MVELEKTGIEEDEFEKSLDCTNSSGHGSRPESRVEEDLDPVDLELVEKLRTKLKAEFDEQVHSRSHYEEIIDEKSAFTCWRYLVHRNQEVSAALTLAKTSLAWRKESGKDDLHVRRQELMKEIWFSAPFRISGTTRDGSHDVIYVTGRNYRKPDAFFKDVVRKYVATVLIGYEHEHLHDLRQLVMVFDVTDTGYRNLDLDFMTWLISVRDFVPARISQIYVVGTPYLMQPIIKLIISWLPESFRNLVKVGSMEELVHQNIAPESLPLEVGGESYKAYLAPLDVPWLDESAIFNNPSARKSVHDCIWYNTSEEHFSFTRNQQLEYEQQLKEFDGLAGVSEAV